MTEYPNSTIKSLSDAAWLNFKAARAAAEAVKHFRSCEVRESITTIAKEMADVFFETPSSSLGAVADKVQTLWADVIFSESPEAEYRRMIVGDIRRLERVSEGVEEPDASGGIDPSRVATEWSDALADYASSSIAEAQLLLKRAPDLKAVIYKLELLGGGMSPRHASILQDLAHFRDAEPR